MDNLYESHPSLSASLGDFEENRPSPNLRLPSQHSGFRSDFSDGGMESNGEVPYSPVSPSVFGRQDTSSRWFRHNGPYVQSGSTNPRASSSPYRSRGMSLQYESANEAMDDVTFLAANIPLPRGSLSPSKPSTRHQSPEEPRQRSTLTDELEREATGLRDSTPINEPQNNYIRLGFHGEVQQKTDAFEALISWIQHLTQIVTKSRLNFGSSISIAIFAFIIIRMLVQTPMRQPLPDIVKAAGLARSFEPMIYYSENGVKHIRELRETGVAVWDLGESVRAANMTSAPIIVDKLEVLGETLEKLAMELTRFFANVDGDIDGILMSLDWAKREMAAISSTSPPSSISSVVMNINSIFCRLGILEDLSTGSPTHVGKLITSVFGKTSEQSTRDTMQRTFTEILTVLESSIVNEIKYAGDIFSLFASIDVQFEELHRTTMRESDTQERNIDNEFLASLWTRVMGPNAWRLRKFEKNRDLLQSVRKRTLANKSLLIEHNGKLLSLKETLEMVRKRLVSPLIRGAQGASASGVEDQIRGLEGIFEHMDRIRETQKSRNMEATFGGRWRESVVVERGPAEIES